MAKYKEGDILLQVTTQGLFDWQVPCKVVQLIDYYKVIKFYSSRQDKTGFKLLHGEAENKNRIYSDDWNCFDNYEKLGKLGKVLYL